jgi:hypothetical protein
MFIAGHVGLGLGILATARRALGLRGRLSLAWVAFFALLPDIIDKPVGLIWWELGSRRLLAHSLLFCLLAMLCCRLLWPRLSAYSWLLPTHLLLDRMWLSRYTLLFPLLGLRFDPDPLPPDGIASLIKFMLWKVIHYPGMLVGEVSGLAVLGLYLIWGLMTRPPEPEALEPAAPEPEALARRRRPGPSPP